MQKTIKRMLAVLLCAALLFGAAPLAAFAADPTSGSCGSGVTWSYNTSSKTLTIRGSGNMSDYSTEYYGEYSVPVTTAPWRPYYMTMKNVVIENGVKSIGASAFYFCMTLESVTFPASVTSSGTAAFAGCSSLNAVKIADVGAWCGITFADGMANPLYYAHRLYLNNSLLTDLVIPEGVTSIHSNAFSNCTSITSLTIPEGVTTIENSAFLSCFGLTSVNFPNSLTTLGNSVFECCAGLTSVILPNSITSIGYDSFAYCAELTDINVPDGVTEIDSNLFYGCVKLESVTIGSSVTSVSYNAFLVNCSTDTRGYLQSDYDRAIENGVTETNGTVGYLPVSAIRTILDHPTGSLTDVYFRGTEEKWKAVYISSYGNEALNNATKHFAPGFMGLVFVRNTDDTVTVIDCNDWLAEIAIPAGIDGGTVTAIGNEAFKGNNMMTSLTIPRTVTSIGKKIFQATVPDYYHSMAVSSINSLKATYEQYGLDVRDYFRDRMEIDGPIFLETVRYDEMIYYVDHGVWPTTSLTDVYFEGTEAEWNQIAIDPDNTILLGATLHFLDVEHSHSYVSSVTEPTCTEAGSRTYTCACGDVVTETIKARGHYYTDEVTQAATCSATGVRTYTCTRCGYSYTEDIPTVPHTYVSVITTAPTCTEPGLRTKTCSVCQAVTTEIVPALGHDLVTTVTKEPTCTEEGACDKTCTRCDYVSHETLPMINHIDADGDGLCDACGSDDINLSDIQVDETKTIEVAAGQTVKLCFIPKVTGTYSLTANSDSDTYGYLYDADMNELTHNDDRYSPSWSSDFRVTYPLVKGQTYYFGCRYYSSYKTGSFTVTLTLDSMSEPLNAKYTKNAVIDTMNGIIYGLEPQVTDPSEYFITKPSYTCSVTPSGRNGETDIYSTGSLVSVYYDDTLFTTYALVLFGDVNGDGWYDGTDAYLVSLLANGMIRPSALTAAQRKACDANHDGAITAADVALLEQAGLLLSEVDQNGRQEELQTNSLYLDYCGLIDQTIETIEPDDSQPSVVDRPQPVSQSIWNRITTLFRVVLNWMLGIFKVA